MNLFLLFVPILLYNVAMNIMVCKYEKFQLLAIMVDT